MCQTGAVVDPIAVRTVKQELAFDPRGITWVVFCCFSLESAQHHMDAITALLEDLRGEKAPAERFDPRKTGLSETGDFRKPDRKQKP